MDLHLDFSNDEQSLLRQQADALGMDVADFIVLTLREKLGHAADDDIELPDDEWQARLGAFAGRHRPTGHALDDRRESIYPDRT